MDDRKRLTAQTCLKGAEDNTMTFPQIVGRLMQDGFEGYAIDFRRAKATYYTPEGDSIELPTHRIAVSIASAFDPIGVQAAIKDAQQLAPGYTYLSFCNRIASAGCAAYIVSFSGRRALYIGRTAETHQEQFPD